MYGQITLIDGIRSFSPTRERWLSKPSEELPDRVTVIFQSGQIGFLDMKSPGVVHLTCPPKTDPIFMLGSAQGNKTKMPRKSYNFEQSISKKIEAEVFRKKNILTRDHQGSLYLKERINSLRLSISKK